MALQGFLEFWRTNVIGGWAWDSGRADQRMVVEILVDGNVSASVVAREYREDLKQNGVGDGFYGFWYVLPSSVDPNSVDIAARTLGVVLPRCNAVPLPTPDLIYMVTGGNDPIEFLRTGFHDAEIIRDDLEKLKFDISKNKKRILDWGCGCGRIARHWQPFSSTIELFGCDIYEPSIKWSHDNISFGTFNTCNVLPPLPYPDDYFDAIYAISVLTHLDFQSHYLWMQEIWRILKFGGCAVLTTAGPSLLVHRMQNMIGKAPEAKLEVNLIDEEDIFLTIGQEEGSNNFGNLETYGAFTKIFWPFNILYYGPRAGLMGIQDTYVLTKKSRGPLSLLPVFYACTIEGLTYAGATELTLNGQSSFAVLASAKNLVHPATLRLSILLPDSAEIVASSAPVVLSDKASWASLDAAYAMIVIDNIPELDDRAVLSLDVRSAIRMEEVHLQLRNAMLF